MTYPYEHERRPRRHLLYVSGVALGLIAMCALFWVGLIVAGVWFWGLVL